MAGSNKILTVSYGTFSCTLEGFDNPFGTMQSIAEYFRDLAADDRYFGAEPPQPDAQMLHQIAEREVRRRVEARVGDNGVVLRQVSGEGMPEAAEKEAEAPADAKAEAPAEPAAAPTSETVAERLARIRQVVAKARAERTRTYEEDEEVDIGDDESLLSAFATAEDVALSDDSDDYTVEPEVDDDSEPTATASDLALTDAEDDKASEEEELRQPEAAYHVGKGTEALVAAGLTVISVKHSKTTREAPAETDTTAAEETPEETEAPAEATVATPEETEAAADAMVATPEETEANAAEAAEETETTAADAAAEADEAPETGKDVTHDAPVDIEMDAAEGVAEMEGAEVAETPEEPEAEEAAPQAGADQAGATETADEDDLARIEAAVAEAEAPVSQDAAFDDSISGDAGDEMIEVEMEDENGQPSLVMMKRSEFEAALASGEIEEVEEDDQPETASGGEDSSDAEDTIRGLLADAQMDEDAASALAAELAEIEGAGSAEPKVAETTDEDGVTDEVVEVITKDSAAVENEGAKVEPEQAEPEQAEPEQAEPAKVEPEQAEPEKVEAQTAEAARDDDEATGGEDEKPASRMDEAGDQTITRLIDETNSHMGEPEGNRRRSAIQHLRRAAMATKADDRLRERNDATDSIEQFRNDLDQAVRPKRPVQSGETANGQRRPAGPLVLVSSQRVDLKQAPVRPVRPERPAALKVAEQDDRSEPQNPASAETKVEPAQESFADFAQKLGAYELPDLLEAAAAYSKIVEGQEGISRPALIRRAATASGGQITREEGLKSFGLLLRSGRIKKVNPGRFALAESAEIAQKARTVH